MPSSEPPELPALLPLVSAPARRYQAFVDELYGPVRQDGTEAEVRAGYLSLLWADYILDGGSTKGGQSERHAKGVDAAIQEVRHETGVCQAIRLVRDELRNSTFAPNPSTLLSHLLGYASGLEEAGSYLLAADVAESVMARASAIKLPGLESKAGLVLARVLRRLGRWEDAEATCLRVERAASLHGDGSAALWAKISAGKVAMERGDLTLAEARFKAIHEQAIRLNLPQLQGMALHEMGAVYFRQNMFRQALTVFEQALAIQPDALELSLLLIDIATASAELGAVDLARQANQHVANTDANVRLLGMAYTNLVWLESLANNHIGFERNRRQLVELPLTGESKVLALIEIAEGLTRLGKVKTARMAYEQARESAIAERTPHLLKRATIEDETFSDLLRKRAQNAPEAMPPIVHRLSKRVEALERRRQAGC